MKLYLTKTPRFVQLLLSNIIWCFDKNKKEIYLTFDDGPTPNVTDWVLDELAKYNAKATFFCIGKNIEKHPKIFLKTIENGHSIGNHTHNHLNGLETDNISYFKNTLKCEKTIQQFNDLTIQQKLFRPPYGKIKPNQIKFLKNKNYKIVLWDVLSADFDANINQDNCLQNVLKNTKNGSIIVFHDSFKAFNKLKYVLPNILKYYSDRGFAFKKIEV